MSFAGHCGATVTAKAKKALPGRQRCGKIDNVADAVESAINCGLGGYAMKNRILSLILIGLVVVGVVLLANTPAKGG